VSSRRTIEGLRPGHDLSQFDCDQPDLNQWLKKQALPNQFAGSSKTYVALVEECVAGFYTLSFGHVEHNEAADRLKKGLARHPIPVMLLARLAVDKRFQNKGVGKGMLKDAVMRTLTAANVAGLRALIVHAKDEKARQYYERFDFRPSPTDPLHLYALVKDIQKSLGVSGG